MTGPKGRRRGSRRGGGEGRSGVLGRVWRPKVLDVEMLGLVALQVRLLVCERPPPFIGLFVQVCIPKKGLQL